MEPFQYTPLDLTKNQIRLIKIRARVSPSDIVQCEMATFDEADCPKYCALSYTWGSAVPSFTIKIWEKSFEVRQNLHYFLANVVRTEALKIELLFVDQLCINQSSEREVNHLVQRMPDIYRNADHVVVWIGAGTSPINHKWHQISPVASWGAPQKDWMIRALRQPYWTRLWVVQEIMQAAQFSLLFDGVFFSFQQLGDLMTKDYKDTLWMSEIESAPMQLFNMIRGYRFGYFDASIRPRNPDYHLDRNLDCALAKWAHLECHDPRDKVYGLLGTVRPCARIEVEYVKTAAEVFWTAMAAFSSEAFDAYAPKIFQLAKSMGVTGQEPGASRPDVLNRFHETFGWDREPKELFGFETWEVSQHSLVSRAN